MFVMARIILHTADQVPANYVQNQIAFTSGSEDPDIDAVMSALDSFYTALGSGYFSNKIAGTGHEVKFYEMPGLTPNYPFEERTFDLNSAPTGDSLPQEVALVLSFQGSRSAGFPMARRRGRIYVGPLKSTTSTDGRPTSGVISGLVTAAEEFGDDIKAIPGHQWCVWSTVDADMVPIVSGWVDNAWDTQRRRGVTATSRTTFTVLP